MWSPHPQQKGSEGEVGGACFNWRIIPGSPNGRCLSPPPFSLSLSIIYIYICYIYINIHIYIYIYAYSRADIHKMLHALGKNSGVCVHFLFLIYLIEPTINWMHIPGTFLKGWSMSVLFQRLHLWNLNRISGKCVSHLAFQCLFVIRPSIVF